MPALITVSAGAPAPRCRRIRSGPRPAARVSPWPRRGRWRQTRGRIASLLLAESLTLALPAALLSLPVALLTMRGIASGVPGIPAAGVDVELSVAAMLVAVGAAVASALAFGLFPLRNLIRIDPGKALRTYSVRQTSSRGVMRFRAALATVQIALSMALLVMTGVFGRTLANIASIDLPLDVDSVVMLSVSSTGRSGDAASSLYERLDEELEAIPGVSAVASSTIRLLSIGGFEGRATVEGIATEPFGISMHPVSPDFLEMFGIEFVNRSPLSHIYLPAEFEGHPLRKDFPLLARRVKPWPGIVDVEPMPGTDDGGEGDGEEEAS